MRGWPVPLVKKLSQKLAELKLWTNGPPRRGNFGVMLYSLLGVTFTNTVNDYKG